MTKHLDIKAIRARPNLPVDIHDMADWIEAAEQLIPELIAASEYAPDYFVNKWEINKTVEAAKALLNHLKPNP